MNQPSQALYDEADTDGLVVFGSRVIVYTMSGRLVLALTTEQDNSISELIDYCLRKCAANEAIPQVCVGLQWKPPVQIPSPVGLNLRQRPVLMEATLVQIPITSAPSMIMPTPETPLYSALLKKIEKGSNENPMESFAELYMFDKLKFKQPYGSAEQPRNNIQDPYEVALRVEHLLQVTQEQRLKHIARLKERNDLRADQPDTVVFNGDDMSEILNAWRSQPRTWMRESTWQRLQNIESWQAYHQKLRGNFNTMLFQLFGNKALVDFFIRYPICSVDKPASLLENFREAWADFANSGERWLVQVQSRERARLSKRICKLQERQKRAEELEQWVDNDWNNWCALSDADKSTYTEQKHGSIQREIDDLKAQKKRKIPT